MIYVFVDFRERYISININLIAKVYLYYINLVDIEFILIMNNNFYLILNIDISTYMHLSAILKETMKYEKVPTLLTN